MRGNPDHRIRNFPLFDFVRICAIGPTRGLVIPVLCANVRPQSALSVWVCGTEAHRPAKTEFFRLFPQKTHQFDASVSLDSRT